MANLSEFEIINQLKTRFQNHKETLKQVEKLKNEIAILNNKLLNTEKEQSLFLSNVRNEINNPLSSIIALSENIMSSGKGNFKDVQSAVEMIFLETFQLNMKLNNSIIAAELEAGECMPNITKVNIDELIKNECERFRYLFKSKALEVNFNSELSVDSKQTLFFQTDSEKLQLVLNNLLSNAVEFSQDGNQLEISVWMENNDLNISVKDNGEGIQKEEQTKIFNRFKQLETGTTKSHKGLGLGLSVVHDLVTLLNGVISISSEKGEGSIFTISLTEMETQLSDTMVSNGSAIFFE